MNNQEKISVKKLLVNDPVTKQLLDDNKNNNNKSTTTILNSLDDVPSSNMQMSTYERFRLFREKCGIIDNSTELSSAKSLTIRQEFAKYDLLEKKGHTYQTFWKMYETSLPILSKLARRFGCVTASSVP
ncbi:unnamed protein product, partial [Adineta steineri]